MHICWYHGICFDHLRLTPELSRTVRNTFNCFSKNIQKKFIVVGNVASIPYAGWLFIGWSICFLKGKKLYFHDPIGALIFFKGKFLSIQS